MPNGEYTGFPVFPTQFTEEEQKRMDELESLRKRIAQVYQAKFTPEAWAKVPILEKGVREFLPEWMTGKGVLAPLTRAVTPWKWGWEYGFTPAQAQDYRLEMEEEYKELVRQEKITRLLPTIQTDLVIAALAGSPITDITELLSEFPELRSDFTEEERAYLSSFAQGLVHATPEDILSGKAFAPDPTKLPITPEDVEALAKDPLFIDPRYILSTVAFSKSLADISLALQQAYPPQTELPEGEVDEAMRQRLLDYFRQRARDMGITVGEDEPVQETIKKVHEKIAEEEGSILTLLDETTGELFTAKRKPDNTVWFEGEILGYYDEKSGKVLPINYFTGEPYWDEAEQEGQFKDLMDSFYLGIQQAWYGTKQGILTVLKDVFAPPKGVEYEGKRYELGTGGFPGQRKVSEKLLELFNSWSESQQAEHEEWLKDHPELMPRPEYTQSPIEHPELLKDPFYYAYTIISNAPIIGAALITGLATTIATKNPWAGAVAGAAVITPVQINSVREDLIANGAPPEVANELASSVGTLMGAVEILPGMIVLKAASPMFMRLFRKELQSELSKQVVKKLTAKGILLTATKIEVAETLEEITQQAMQNAAVKTVNENRSIIQDLPETAINTAISVAPLALFGGGAEYLNMKSQLPSEVQDNIGAAAKKMEEAGLSKDHAEAVAFTKVVETELGEAQVEEAVKKMDEKAAEVAIAPAAVPVGQVRIWEDWKESGKTIQEYVDWLGTQEVSFSSFQRTARQHRVSYIREQKRPEGAIRKFPSERAFGKRELELLDAVYKKFGKHYGWYKAREVRKPSVVEPTVEPTARVAKETERLSKKLETINTDIDTFAASMIAQEARYTKMKLSGTELPSDLMAQRATIDGLAETVKELEAEKTSVLKAQKQLKKVVKAPVAVPEVRTEQLWDTLEVSDRALWAKQAKLEGIEKTSWAGLTAAQQGDLLFARAQVQPEIIPEPVPEALVVPDPNADRETTPDKRPRLKDWADDQIDTEKAVNDIKAISNKIIPSKTTRESRVQAERTLDGLHASLEGLEGEEEVKAITDEFKALSKQSGLTKKKLLASHWNDLIPPDRATLALSMIPDRSVAFPAIREVFDMRYYIQFLEEETGLPFYSLFKRMEMSHGAARLAAEDMLLRIGKDPMLREARTDKKSLARITQQINSKNPLLNVQPIEDMTDPELYLMSAVEDILTHYEPYVRFLRAMGTDSDMDSFKLEFPDAVEAGKEVELDLAIKLKKAGEQDGLWSFLKTVSWGTMTGYTPWMKAKASIFPPSIGLGTTRGAARLMRRDSVEFDKTLGENLLLDIAKYIKQIEAQWRLRPELEAFEENWKLASSKFENKGQVESVLREWSRELQGIPTRASVFDSIVRRVWRQAMSAVFLHPWMSFRNFHQHLAFHPDRSELFRLIVQKPSARMQEMGRIYFDAFASQLKGIRREWLYMGERGIPGLGWLTRLSDTLSLYSHSDNIPRWWSFEASMNKAMRATEQYQKDGNVAKWLKASGANHLRQTERNYALQLLAQEKFDLAVPGLNDVSGGEMASLYIGHEVANMTHFIYERAFRAPVEHGAMGRTLYNLIVFPRGYVQRLTLQFNKLFSHETTWEQARAGLKDIILITIVGIMISEWLKKVTGRPRRAYNPADIIQWQLGGLVIGVGMDTTKLISDVVVALDPTVDEEYKADVLSRIPGELIRELDVLVPFYRNLLDSIEASTDTKNIDVQMLRKLRALVDDKYTPEEVETMERNLWEKFRKAILAGEPPDPTQFEDIQTSLIEAQARLGEMDATGRFYTLRQFGGDIKTSTKPLPDDMLTEQYNFSELVIFYKECEDEWKELYKLSSSPASKRQEWRKSHEEVEAMLLFWGMYSESIFRRGSPEWNRVASHLQVLFDYHGIDKRMHQEWASWSLPVR